MKKTKSIQLLNSIKNLILKKNIFQPNQTILVGISGGQDSIYLLIVFFLLQKQWYFQIDIVYYHHLWQKNTFYGYNHIFKISYCLNKKYLYSPTFKKLISEEKSRYWRSKQYYRFLEFLNSSIILTGHTLSDQVETLFFNISRGSSLKGGYALNFKKSVKIINKSGFFLSENELLNFLKLKSLVTKNIFKLKKKEQLSKIFFLIKKKNFTLIVIRPLIRKTRFDIKNICQIWKLPLIPDKSNQESKFSRNRLRKQLVPSFRFFFNPKLEITLYRHNNLVLEEEFFFENLIIKLISNSIYENNNCFFLNTSLFNSFDITIQRRICLYFFQENLKIKYNFLLLDAFLNFVNKLVFINKNTNHKKETTCIFYPEIGTIYLSETVLIFLK